jgi:hypothetical protein
MKVKVENKEINSKELDSLISFCFDFIVYAKLEAYPHMIFYTDRAIVKVKTRFNKRGRVIKSW